MLRLHIYVALRVRILPVLLVYLLKIFLQTQCSQTPHGCVLGAPTTDCETVGHPNRAVGMTYSLAIALPFSYSTANFSPRSVRNQYVVLR